ARQGADPVDRRRSRRGRHRAQPSGLRPAADREARRGGARRDPPVRGAGHPRAGRRAGNAVVLLAPVTSGLMGFMDRLAKASDKFYDRMRSADATSVADAEPRGSINDLKGHKYCVLVSYRKNGQAMPS